MINNSYPTSYCDCFEFPSGCKAKKSEIEIQVKKRGEENNLKISKIEDDLATALNEMKYSDVVIISEENQKLYASKSILCSRSGFFKGRFSGNWETEKDENGFTILRLNINKNVILESIFFFFFFFDFNIFFLKFSFEVYVSVKMQFCGRRRGRS